MTLTEKYNQLKATVKSIEVRLDRLSESYKSLSMAFYILDSMQPRPSEELRTALANQEVRGRYDH